MTTPKGPTPNRTYFGKTTHQDLRKLDATPNRISTDFPSEKDLLRQKDLVKCFGTDVGFFGEVICTCTYIAYMIAQYKWIRGGGVVEPILHALQEELRLGILVAI